MTPSIPSQHPQRGTMPRWGWALIAVLTAITAVAVSTAVFGRGGELAATPPAQNSSTSTPIPSASTSVSPTAWQGVDGCLGGNTDVEKAILEAQQKAPLTRDGAASFTASYVRWVNYWPTPNNIKKTAQSILAPDATQASHKELIPEFQPSGVDKIVAEFSTGKYYIESFDGNSAVVSWATMNHGYRNGRVVGHAIIWGTLHLTSINGKWHVRDTGGDRSPEDINDIGSRYPGGC